MFYNIPYYKLSEITKTLNEESIAKLIDFIQATVDGEVHIIDMSYIDQLTNKQVFLASANLLFTWHSESYYWKYKMFHKEDTTLDSSIPLKKLENILTALRINKKILKENKISDRINFVIMHLNNIQEIFDSYAKHHYNL